MTSYRAVQTIKKGGAKHCCAYAQITATRTAMLLHASNDEVERRGIALPTNEAALSQSSIPSLPHRRRDPRSLEPMVRHKLTLRRALEQ